PLTEFESKSDRNRPIYLTDRSFWGPSAYDAPASTTTASAPNSVPMTLNLSFDVDVANRACTVWKVSSNSCSQATAAFGLNAPQVPLKRNPTVETSELPLLSEILSAAPELAGSVSVKASSCALATVTPANGVIVTLGPIAKRRPASS